MKGYVYAVTVIGPMEEKKVGIAEIFTTILSIDQRGYFFTTIVFSNVNDDPGGDDQGNSEVDDGVQEEGAWRPQRRRRWKALGDFCQSSTQQDLPESQNQTLRHHSWVKATFFGGLGGPGGYLERKR